MRILIKMAEIENRDYSESIVHTFFQDVLMCVKCEIQGICSAKN